MNGFIIHFIRNYLLESFLVMVIISIILECVKSKFDFDKNDKMHEYRIQHFRKYIMLENIFSGIQVFILVVTLVLMSVAIYSLTIPCQF